MSMPDDLLGLIAALANDFEAEALGLEGRKAANAAPGLFDRGKKAVADLLAAAELLRPESPAGALDEGVAKVEDAAEQLGKAITEMRDRVAAELLEASRTRAGDMTALAGKLAEMKDAAVEVARGDGLAHTEPESPPAPLSEKNRDRLLEILAEAKDDWAEELICIVSTWGTP